MSRYKQVADLPLTVESVSSERRERNTSSGFTRVTTTVTLHGDGETGRGEDVVYESDEHDGYPAPAVDGEYTIESFSAFLDGVDLWNEDPEGGHSRAMRRWAFEAAALDLALKQADRTLGDALGTSYDSLRFVVSTRVESFDRIETILEITPEAEFKLDPTSAWSADLVKQLADTGRVRALDFKGHYEGTEIDTDPDPAFYDRILSAFAGSDVLFEDPALIDEVRPLFDGLEDRVAWDYPITGVESVEALPWQPGWLNLKPSRFGTLRAVLDTVDYAAANDIRLYGGGQFELSVGREQVQALASLLYPDAPNDVAPGGYNDPDPAPDLPASPLDPPVGFGRR